MLPEAPPLWLGEPLLTDEPDIPIDVPPDPPDPCPLDPCD